jgi:hypothetical protein
MASGLDPDPDLAPTKGWRTLQRHLDGLVGGADHRWRTPEAPASDAPATR